ncbi:ABC transporter ATP-binding protein, partial [archaeon]|nr:ABC transporter ATP-binding protein [archaeon]
MYRLVVKNLSKKFSIGCKKKDSTLARVISILSNKESKKKFQVLKNISFNVKEGEMLGIIGNNGSGKSTLLRTIAGIYKADKGTVEINGRVISVINLNAGLNMRLTMKDNIFLCSSLYGLSKKQTQHIFNKIILFAELEKYIDTKLYQFSSGMLARLSFSIAIFCTI